MGSPRRVRLRLLSVGLMVAAVAACTPSSSSAPRSVTSERAGPSGSAGPAAAKSPVAAAGVSLIIEPDDGMQTVYAVLDSAHHSLDLEMYEFDDAAAESMLAAEAARGVVIRVVLDRNREGRTNSTAFSYLADHGVDVHWAPPGLEADHEKSAVIDAGYTGATALIMTLNLTSRYYADTRDVAVVDRRSTDIGAIEKVFAADYAGRPSSGSLPGTDLVWSPGSGPALSGFIRGSRQTLAVEEEEMASEEIVDALASTAVRGARIEVVMTDAGSYRSELRRLVSSGVSVHLLADDPGVLYIHAKFLVADAGLPNGVAFVGSENFSSASLDHNRELGIVVSDPALVDRLAALASSDYRLGPAFSS